MVFSYHYKRRWFWRLVHWRNILRVRQRWIMLGLAACCVAACTYSLSVPRIYGATARVHVCHGEQCWFLHKPMPTPDYQSGVETLLTLVGIAQQFARDGMFTTVSQLLAKPAKTNQPVHVSEK